MARPRKYASDAERQAAYRDRYALIEIRVTAKVADTLRRIAAAQDISRNELAYNILAWGLANRDWATAPLYARLPRENPDELDAPPASYQVQHRPGGSGAWLPVGGLHDRAEAVRRAQEMARACPFDAVRVVAP